MKKYATTRTTTRQPGIPRDTSEKAAYAPVEAGFTDKRAAAMDKIVAKRQRKMKQSPTGY